jgi:hypothetical protein
MEYEIRMDYNPTNEHRKISCLLQSYNLLRKSSESKVQYYGSLV